jgi:1-deoxy-D-xylulose-5-phosphate reductoisomerase
VSINSATLVNKGLEVIEAHLLFDISYDQIEVVIHPQSYIHSLVEFEDGSTTAQLSPPNMKVPIAYSLTTPDRGYRISMPVDWSKSHTWQFLPIETLSYPGLELAFESGRSGGISPAIFNAANESAVAAFLSGKLPFTSITKVIERVLNDSKNAPSQSIDTILDVAKVQDWAHLKSQVLISERLA